MPLYAALIYGAESDPGAEPDPEAWGQVMAEYGEFGENAGAAGVLRGGEALQDTGTATTVHHPDGRNSDVVHTDGPFAETKEVLGGFYLLECADLDEALGWAAQIPGSWHGRVEVRPCIEFEDM